MTNLAAPQGPSPGEVRVELSRVLDSPEFTASRQLTNFLRFVIEEELAGRGDSLKERTLAIGALGRDGRFDPRLDCVVRVVALKLRHALDRYYAIDGASDPLRIDIPRGGYRPAVRTMPTDAAGSEFCSSPPARNRWRNGRQVISVVPFFTHTGGRQERLFAEILAEDLTVRLYQVGWLEVVDDRAPRNTRVTTDNRTSGSRSRADYVLTGTVYRVGSWVHLTARLSHAKSGILIWAEQYQPRVDRDGLIEESDVVSQIVANVCSGIEAHYPADRGVATH